MSGVLLVLAIAVGHVVRQGHRFLEDLLEGLLENARVCAIDVTFGVRIARGFDRRVAHNTILARLFPLSAGWGQGLLLFFVVATHRDIGEVGRGQVSVEVVQLRRLEPRVHFAVHELEFFAKLLVLAVDL